VNADLTPALTAAGGGSALITGIWAYERRRDEAMRASMVRLGCRFPIGLEPAQALAALDGISGLPHTAEVIAEMAARENSVTHALWVPASAAASVQSTLGGAIPSLRVGEEGSPPDDATTRSLRLFVSTPTLLSDENAVSTSRALLSALAGLRSGELVSVRLCLRPGGGRPWRAPEKQDGPDRALARSWARKTTSATFAVSGLVLIRASNARSRSLAAHIESVLRGRRGEAGGFRVTQERGSRRMSARPIAGARLAVGGRRDAGR
jgi:hypothetical protein